MAGQSEFARSHKIPGSGPILGVTPPWNASYNQGRSFVVTQRILSSKMTIGAAFVRLSGLSLRAAWSRPVSMRADSKFSPCMARPNLFSGD